MIIARLSRQRRVIAALVAGLLMASGLVWAAGPSFAVHDTGQFELDGNIAHNSATTPPYDWASMFGAGGTRLVTPDPNNGPVLASGFVDDTVGGDNTYFAGGVKIGDAIHTWSCGGPPASAKTSVNYTYATLIQIPAGAPDNAGHTVLYLGVEKQAGGVNGDNAFGFWLFKNSGVGCSGSGAFTGAHTDGDIFIDGTFTNGGGSSDVQVYRWNGNDATGSISANPILTGAVCGGAAHDNACAIANAASIPAGAWNASGTNAANTFVEAGIDITNLLGAAGGCFTSFLADSQSSQSTGSQPKDYAAGQFNTCPEPPVTTTATPGGSTVAPGTAQHDVATLDAVGSRGTPTGSIAFYLCQPAQVTAAGCPAGAGAQIGSGVALTAGSATSASTTNDTTLGKYCWRAEYTPDAASSGVYLPTKHTNATTECFTVAHGSPTLTTQIAVTGDSPPALGLTTLGDTATLHDFVGTPDGAVTFNLYGPFADGVTPTCGGTPVFSTTGAVNGSGVATTSSTYTPTAAGTYVWRASWPGNALNDAATDACNEASEKTTVIGATIDVSKSAVPAGPVSAGEGIGFDITVHNSGSVPATGVVVTDNLPAGGDLDWSVDAFGDCAITGAVGHEVLTCHLGTIAGGASAGPIHVTAATTALDCGVVTNKATVSTTNGTGGDSDNATVTVLCAAVSLTKTADAASVSAGAPIGFTVTASNSNADGTGTAKGVVIDDPLPGHAGISWSLTSGAPSNCSITGTAPNQTLHCTAVDLAKGASESVHVTSSTVFASCATYDNTATLTATNTGGTTASASTQVLCPNLSITKTADPGPVNAGTSIGYTVTAHNSGAGAATGALVSDTLPTGSGIAWTIASDNGPLTCAISAGVLSCSGTLAAGATETVHITSPTTFASCGTYDNTATLSSTVVPAITSDQASVTVLCAALGVTKTADAASVNAGSPIGFVITATNTGEGDATGALVHDELPTGSGIAWSVDAAGTSGPLTCAVASGALSCTGTLGAGDTEVVHITSATVFASCGTYNNTAQLSATNAGDTVNSNVASTVVNCPALSATKTADDPTVNAGESIGFTVTAHNDGPGDAVGALVHDELPTGSGVDWTIDSSNGPLTCTIDAGVLSCTGTLGADETQTVHISSGTAFASCGTYNNTATLTADNAGNQAPSGSASTVVECPAPVITKTADAATVNAGAGIGFTITAGNSDAEGTGTAVDVVINDPLPAGTGVEWSIESGPPNCEITGTAPDQTLACSPVDLAPGDSEVIHVVSATVFASCGTYDNTATLTLSNGPEATGEVPAAVAATFSASASTEVQCSALAITKVADAATVNAGKAIGFTIDVSNAGPGTAIQAVVEDPLPSGSGVKWAIDPAYDGPGACVIEGSADSQALVCELGDFPAEATASVHITSATTDASCAAYDNTVTLLADNAPTLTAAASTTVANCAGVLPETPPVTPVPPATHGVAGLAATGAGQISGELAWAIGLVVLGGLLLAATRRRRAEEQ